MTTSDSTMKTCTKCKQTYPATAEFFRPDKQIKSGWKSWCRGCHRENSREYASAHRKEKREYLREYRAAHLEKARERGRKYQHENPEKARAGNHRRRARKRAAEGIGARFDEKAQLKRQHGKCYYCQCKLTEYHVDHIVPLSRGGSDYPDNKVLACPACNQSKSFKLPHEWAKGGRLL